VVVPYLLVVFELLVRNYFLYEVAVLVVVDLRSFCQVLLLFLPMILEQIAAVAVDVHKF